MNCQNRKGTTQQFQYFNVNDLYTPLQKKKINHNKPTPRKNFLQTLIVAQCVSFMQPEGCLSWSSQRRANWPRSEHVYERPLFHSRYLTFILISPWNKAYATSSPIKMQHAFPISATPRHPWFVYLFNDDVRSSDCRSNEKFQSLVN